MPRKQIPRISCYTKLLIVVQDLVSVRTALVIHSKKKIVIPSNDSGLSVREKLPSFRKARAILWKKLSSAVRTARAIRWKKFSSLRTASYCSKPLSPEPFATNLSKNVSLNDLRNSSKLCLPSPHDHEFSRYIFCWIAFCAFITSIIVTSFIQE